MLGVSIVLKRLTHILGLLVVLAACSFALTGSALSEDWSSYQPAHTLGSGENDWWSTYPAQHQDAGKAVEHPSFVLDALKEKPVLVLVHSSTCKSCAEQIANLNSAMKSYGSDLNYNDVLGEGSNLEKAVGILDVYDPTGGAQYVPTTIFITLIKGSDGKVQVAWHSQIDAMDAGQIEGYIKDSIYYYKQNAANWK
jgi:hypothetical protein